MIKIAADDKIPFLRGILEPFAEISYLSKKDFTPENIKDADILLVRTPNKCTRELLRGSRVKFIATTTIGFDHIDIDYCREAGIRWVNCPGCNAVSVSQFLLASLIELSRKEGFSLRDKTFGIVGVGNVGSQVQRVYDAYGLNYLLCDPLRAKVDKTSAFVDLKTIAERCDVISFHVPLTYEGDYPTYHLADEVFFQSLKKTPYFINLARGSVHDTDALIKAKSNHLIKEMVIDCWENEPDISLELLSLALIATPHIAGFSADGKANGTRMCLEAIVKEYNIPLKNLDELIQPEKPLNAVIDLNDFATDRVECAVLRTFSPMYEDQRLRNASDRFEYLRTHYDNPREFHAYTVIHATETEARVLSELGFHVEVM